MRPSLKARHADSATPEVGISGVLSTLTPFLSASPALCIRKQLLQPTIGIHRRAHGRLGAIAGTPAHPEASIPLAATRDRHPRPNAESRPSGPCGRIATPTRAVDVALPTRPPAAGESRDGPAIMRLPPAALARRFGRPLAGLSLLVQNVLKRWLVALALRWDGSAQPEHGKNLDVVAAERV